MNFYFKSYCKGISSAIFGFIFVVAIGAQPTMAQEVNGIYTEAATKKPGEVTGKKSLKGIKFRGWFEAYIERNFNDPSDPSSTQIRGYPSSRRAT